MAFCRGGGGARGGPEIVFCDFTGNSCKKMKYRGILSTFSDKGGIDDPPNLPGTTFLVVFKRFRPICHEELQIYREFNGNPYTRPGLGEESFNRITCGIYMKNLF